ncbi:MAG: HD-GYP domain-containing protein [candidate division KSB1 bacterium]|nr:HD-GYP domain-containing protein [candidate division KSB1 bacterium]MDQ7065044.1 HD-GYP domain-containing protein [candidate division KSB1 bacterium]
MQNLLKVYLNLESETRKHCERVRILAVQIGTRLGLNQRELQHLSLAAQFHDVGKIAVDPAILNQPTRLTARQKEIIRLHPQIGAEIWASLGGDPEIAFTILNHHEHFNGRGYPFGRAGRSIPLPSRIIAIADALDAMLSNRPYRKAMSPAQAAMALLAGSGSQFDPRIVRLILSRPSFTAPVLQAYIHT